jgi:hypothetical protein
VFFSLPPHPQRLWGSPILFYCGSWCKAAGTRSWPLISVYTKRLAVRTRLQKGTEPPRMCRAVFAMTKPRNDVECVEIYTHTPIRLHGADNS